MATRVLIKLGGRVARDAVSVVLEHHAAGADVVVVHGAGPQITAELHTRGISTEFVRGRRYTDEATLAVVRSSLVAVGAEVAAALGPTAVQLVGDEIGLEAVRLPELGFVGKPVPTPSPGIEHVLSAGGVPVVTPLAVGPLNVNADEAATALAEGLDADRIVFVSDVPGVYVAGSVLSLLHADSALDLIRSGTVEGGIVPKLLAAVRAARLGLIVEIGATAVVA